MPHVVIYMYVHLGKDRPPAAETVRNFLCDLLLGTITICFSPPKHQPEVYYHLCLCPVLLILPPSHSASPVLRLQHQRCRWWSPQHSHQNRKIVTGLSKLSTSRKPNTTQYIFTLQHQPTESKLLRKWTASG